MTDKPEVGQRWKNNRNDHIYAVRATPRWSDTPDAESVQDLETWVYLINEDTGEDFICSEESFLGVNRNDEPRFTRIE